MNSTSNIENAQSQGGENSRPPTNKKTFLLKKSKFQEDSQMTRNLPSLPNMPNVKILNPRPWMKVKATQEREGTRIQQNQRISISIKNINDSMTRDTTSQKSVKEPVEEVPMEILEDYFPEVQGPQLKMSKSFISFLVATGQVSKDSITVQNNGTASIYYQWVRVTPVKVNSNSVQDPNEKFYCHHEKNVIQPGEQRRFVFAFISKLTGVFSQDWTLKCEPATSIPLPNLNLTGEAIEVDKLVDWRENFDIATHETHLNQFCGEIIKDVVAQVRTPTPPLPDLNDPEVCKFQFENSNAPRHIYYNQLLMKWFRVLEMDLYEELRLKPEEQWWDLNLNYLDRMIEKVEDVDNRTWFEWRLKELVDLSKKPPVERTTLYPDFDQFIKDIVTELPSIADNTRKELDMWDYVFQVPKQQDPTQAEIKLKNDEYTKMKAEWIKKTKKKKWGEEEDKKMVEEYRQKLSEKVSGTIGSFARDVESTDELRRLAREIDNFESPNISYYEGLMRKVPLKDMDIDGKRVLIRAHLKLNKNLLNSRELMYAFGEMLLKEKEQEEKRQEEERILQEKLAKDQKKGQKPPAGKGKGEVDSPPEPKVKNYDLSFLDQENLAEIIETVKYVLDRLGKLVILMLSYGDPVGQFNPLLSLKFLPEFLKTKLDQQIIFNQRCTIENYSQKIEADSFPENSLIILQNCFFQPEEVRSQYDKQADSLTKYSIEEVEPFRNELSEYCPIIVIEDQVNLFQRYTSINLFDSEYQVLGLTLAHEVSTSGYCMWKQAQQFSVYLGGQLTSEQLMALEAFLNFADSVCLLGEIGIQFILATQNVNQLARITLHDLQKSIIKKVLDRAGDKLSKLLLPVDFQAFSLPENGEYNKEWNTLAKEQFTYINAASPQTIAQSAAIFADPQIEIVNLGEKSRNAVLEGIFSGQKYLWIDQVIRQEDAFVSETTKLMARAFSQLIDEKKVRQEEGKQQSGEIYDFQDDCIVFLCGKKLGDLVNSFPLVEQIPKEDEEPQLDEELDDGQKEESQQGEKPSIPGAVVGGAGEQVKESQQIQPLNVQLISDFYIQDSQFSLKILTGKYIEGLNSVHTYPQKAENNFDDEIIDLFHRAMEIEQQQQQQTSQ